MVFRINSSSEENGEKGDPVRPVRAGVLCCLSHIEAGGLYLGEEESINVIALA